MADTVEQALLLPKDMVDLRFLRRQEIFLSLKRDLAMVSLSFFFFLNAMTPLLFFLFFASFFYFIHVSFLGRPLKPYSKQRR